MSRGLRFGQSTEVRSHGFTFRVDCVGTKHHTTTDSGTCVSRNVAGPYILTYNGKYLARLHPAQVKRWARHFALQMLQPKPAPGPTVAFYRVRAMYNQDGIWLYAGPAGLVAHAKDAKPFTRVQADAYIRGEGKGYRGARRMEAVPVYN